MVPVRIEISGDNKTEIEIYKKIQTVLEPYLIKQNPVVNIFLSPDKETIQLLKKLGNAKLDMLNCMDDERLTVDEIAERFHRAVPTVYNYVRQLSDSGYLDVTKKHKDGIWKNVYRVSEKGKIFTVSKQE